MDKIFNDNSYIFILTQRKGGCYIVLDFRLVPFYAFKDLLFIALSCNLKKMSLFESPIINDQK